MKHLFPALALSAIGFCLPASQATAQPKLHSRPVSKTLNVAFLLYPGVEALDLSGPLDVFIKANDIAPHSFNVYTVAAQSGAITTQNAGLTLTPRYTLTQSPRPDIIVVPGASQTDVARLGQNSQVLRWIRNNSTASQRVMSVCTGAYVLGKAGLLDGKKSTTHWFVLDGFQRQFPKTKAIQGVRYMEAGNIVTTAGVSSGIDGAFLLVEKVRGKAVADMVAKAIQYQRGLPAYPAEPRGPVKLTAPAVSSPVTGQKLASLTDPVCGMPVTAKTQTTFLYQGKLYGFCSPICRDKFAAHPQFFVKTPTKQ